MNEQTPDSIKLFDTAKNNLDKNLCENFAYGCAETVSNLLHLAFGFVVPGAASTYMLLQYLIKEQAFNYFKEVTEAEALPGDIIISATGTSLKPNPDIPNGHVGVVAEYGILSNNSANGLLQEKWNMPSWKQHYEVDGGYPTRIFRPL